MLCFHVTFFSRVRNFIVHDLQTCSSHSEIQLSIDVKPVTKETLNENECTYIHLRNEKIMWKSEQADEFRDLIYCKLGDVETLIDKIEGDEMSLNSGVDILSDLLHNFESTEQKKKKKCPKPLCT